MATLFFDGFNISNNDGSPYLDPKYWTRQPGSMNPRLSYNSYNYDSTESVNDVLANATQGSLNISGYILDSNPPQSPSFLQLSGISYLNSDQIYLSFRVRNLSFNDTVNNFPHAAKFLTFCDGNTESLTIDVVAVPGESIQGGSWGDFSSSGLGLSIKQSGNQVGLYDLRVGDLSSYIFSSGSNAQQPKLSTQIITSSMSNQSRFVHLELMVDRQNNRFAVMIEGVEVFNRLTDSPYDLYANTSPLGIINNIKFYNKGFSQSTVDNASSFTTVGAPYISIDDLVICNNSGNQPNYWLGPKARIYHFINKDNTFLLDNWSVENASSNPILNSRDGDNSYLYSDKAGDITSFQFRNSVILDQSAFETYISDGVGGVRIFNDVRKTFLDTNFINVYAVGDVTDTNNYLNIGDTHIVDRRNYNIKNSFIFEDPIAGQPWNSGTFFEQFDGSNFRISGAWGIKKL